SQPVADLDLRRARDVLEREPADEIAVVAARRAPRPETRVEPVRARNAPQRIVDLLARRCATAADVAHDARIGVELVKLVALGGADLRPHTRLRAATRTRLHT